MHAAVVELDALADAVRPAAQHHDLLGVGRMRLALFLVGRIHVGGLRGKLGRAGVDPLVYRVQRQLGAARTHCVLVRSQQPGQSAVGETGAFELA